MPVLAILSMSFPASSADYIASGGSRSQMGRGWSSSHQLHPGSPQRIHFKAMAVNRKPKPSTQKEGRPRPSAYSAANLRLGVPIQAVGDPNFTMKRPDEFFLLFLRIPHHHDSKIPAWNSSKYYGTMLPCLPACVRGPYFEGGLKPQTLSLCTLNPKP